MLASKFYKVEDDLVEKEGFVLQRLERALGREYSEVRHSLLSRGLLRTLADEVLIERHLRQMGNLHGDPLAKARARFSLAVVQLSEFLDEMGIECPDDIELLVVEDDANDEAATCRAIGNMEVPPDVKVARDGSEALQLLQKGDFLPSMVPPSSILKRATSVPVSQQCRKNFKA